MYGCGGLFESGIRVPAAGSSRNSGVGSTDCLSGVFCGPLVCALSFFRTERFRPNPLGAGVVESLEDEKPKILLLDFFGRDSRGGDVSGL